MKAILGDPFSLLLIVAFSLIYILLAYTWVAKNKTAAVLIEKVFSGIFLFSISGATGVTVSPFSKLHPSNLYSIVTTPPTIIGQLSIYFVFLFILSSRLAVSFRDLLRVFVGWMASDPFIIFVILIFSVSCFWSETPDFTLKASLVILETTAVAFYIGKQYSWKELNPFLRWICFFVVIYSHFRPSAAADGFWKGIIGHKNQFSFFMAQSAVLWLLNAFYSPKLRQFSILVVLLALVALQKGGSGASRVLVIVLLGLWSYLGVVKKLPVQWAFVSVVLFLVISIGLGILIVQNLESIVVDGLGKDMTLTGRTEFWPQIVERINMRPLFGYGAVSFWQKWRGPDNPAYGIIHVASQFVPPHSHNGFLDLATELGWVGLGLFVLSFFNNLAKSVVYLTRAKLPEAGMPLLLLTYVLMTNLTETGLFGATSIWFWYIVVTVRLSLDTTGKI